MKITAYSLAARFVGLDEVPGKDKDNHLILHMLKMDGQKWPEHDEIPWCSAFLNFIAWELRLPRSKSLMARSWLSVGKPISWENARCGFDVVIFSRGEGSPGPEELNAPGHVGLFGYRDFNNVYVVGGNQSDSVALSPYPASRMLGVRRLHG